MDKDPMNQPGSRTDPVADGASEVEAAAAFFEVAIALMRDARMETEPLSLGQDEAPSKLQKGIPLIYGLELNIDIGSVADLTMGLIKAACDLERFASAANKVLVSIEKGEIDIYALVEHAASGDDEYVLNLADRYGLDSGFLRMVLQNALRPAFYSWRRQLTSFLADNEWQKGYCPICGSRAIFGELRGNAQTRHLRCGRCGADWPFRRLSCTLCGNGDHRTLGFLYQDESRERLRVEVCDNCKGYLKVITSFVPLDDDRLQLEDLATLHLDLSAISRGYKRQIDQQEFSGTI